LEAVTSEGFGGEDVKEAYNDDGKKEENENKQYRMKYLNKNSVFSQTETKPIEKILLLIFGFETHRTTYITR
jgi:hypothetical protein